MCHILLIGSDQPLETFASGERFGTVGVSDELSLPEADYRDLVPGRHVYSVGTLQGCACHFELWDQGLEDGERAGEEADPLALEGNRWLKQFLASLRGAGPVWLLHVWEGEEYEEVVRLEATVEELFDPGFLFEEGTIVALRAGA